MKNYIRILTKKRYFDKINVMDLKSQFTWSPIEGKPTAATVTSGTFEIYSDETLIWGSPVFEWSWVEVLEWLNQYWEAINEPLPEAEELNVTDELDFSKFIGGVLLAPLVLVRKESEGYLLTKDAIISVPVDEWQNFINQIAEDLITRLTYSADPRARLAIKEWLSK